MLSLQSYKLVQNTGFWYKTSGSERIWSYTATLLKKLRKKTHKNIILFIHIFQEV